MIITSENWKKIRNSENQNQKTKIWNPNFTSRNLFRIFKSLEIIREIDISTIGCFYKSFWVLRYLIWSLKHWFPAVFWHNIYYLLFFLPPSFLSSFIFLSLLYPSPSNPIAIVITLTRATIFPPWANSSTHWSRITFLVKEKSW